MTDTPDDKIEKTPAAPPSRLAKVRAALKRKPAPPNAAGKEKPSLLESTATLFKAVRDIVISVVVLAAVGFCGVILWNNVRHPHPVIEPIDIPKSVADGGGTTNGFADRIRARIAGLHADAAGQTEASVPYQRPDAWMTQPPRLHSAVESSQAELLDRDGEKKSLVIPDTGLSLDAISDYAKDMFGYRTMLFSGEIVEVDGCDAPVAAPRIATAKPTARKPKASAAPQSATAKAYVLVMQERTDGRLTQACAGGHAAMDRLVDEAALDILEETEPTTAQIVLFKDHRRRAVRLANRVIESYAYSAEEKARSHNLLGTAAADDKNYPGAEEHFKDAIQLDSGGYLYIYERNLCEAMARGGKARLEDALAHCGNALKARDGYARTYVAMANVYALYERYKDAVPYYQKALGVTDRDTKLADSQWVAANLATAQRGWAFQLNASGDKKGALAQFRAAAATCPTPDAFLALGSQQADLGDGKGAGASFRQAASLAPDDGHVQVSVAMQFFVHGAPGDAETYFQQAFAKDQPDAEKALGDLIDSLAAVSQYKAAELILAAAQKAAPRDKTVRTRLQAIRLLEKKHPETKDG
ncbi:MAG TPA: hypothetical protein VGF56_15255 [Rhizomicrobium sp.]|jgi:tetratricopeptide (TPR) repeat protein